MYTRLKTLKKLVLMIEKIYSRVLHIDKDSPKVKVEMYLPEGEIVRVIDNYLVNDMIELGLHHVDAEFYFVVTASEDVIEVHLEQYVQEYDQELEDMYAYIESCIKDQ